MSQNFKRWYDHDPLLMKLLDILKNYQEELKAQAEIFLEKIENEVSKETVDKFYQMVKPINGNRWYDKDVTISKTVELLRVVPVETQRNVAQNFIDSLKKIGIEIDIDTSDIEQK